MNLLTCTFTGVDSFTKEEDLIQIAESTDGYLAEFGVLLHYNKDDRLGKYPPTSWIRHFGKSSLSSVAALHICGTEALQDYVNGEGVAAELGEYFPTVQLNLDGSITLEQLHALFERNDYTTIITQHNSFNKDLWHQLGYDNHAILFDRSGGKGVSPDTYEAPIFEGKIFGYAGGLGPNNISTEMKKIEEVVGDLGFWIDMENNIRTNNKFDAQKCMQVVRKLNEIMHDV